MMQVSVFLLSMVEISFAIIIKLIKMTVVNFTSFMKPNQDNVV